MRLSQSTWPEIDVYLTRCQTIVLPTGSTEQHGPIGLIGTDAICAETIGVAAAERADVLVAPTICYTPAPFNTAFPGTISITSELFAKLFEQIVKGLLNQGFKKIYVVNGHGANLDPMEASASLFPKQSIRIRSWWDFDAVNHLREEFFGAWEGMHATPSEISITQACGRSVSSADADAPPERLSRDYIAEHRRDRHGAPSEHRAQFPDGRVGSHSALARPEHGDRLLEAATGAIAEDILRFSSEP